MVKAHFVKRARKSRPKHGIKKGQSYWFWKFYRQPKQYSLTKPRPSQIMRSEFLSAICGARETIECVCDLLSYDPGAEDSNGEFEVAKQCVMDEIANASDVVQEQLDACEEKASNVSDRFPNGCPTFDLLEQRVDACQRLIDDLKQAEDAVANAETAEDVRAALDAVGWSAV